MAVHFCPALTVISRTTSLTNRSNSGVPGTASRPKMLEFSESVFRGERHRVPNDGRVNAQPRLPFCRGSRK